MLLQLRAFLAVCDEGSINRGAERLRISQSALSRQMQALEHEIGGALLERTSSGITLTPAGRALRARMGSLLEIYDEAILEARRIVRGERNLIRVGYLPSAAKKYLRPALKRFHAAHSEVILKQLDLTPGEQIAAFRAGSIEVGLTDDSATMLAREYYIRELASVPCVVALPATHRLAKQRSIWIAELKDEAFVKVDERQVPTGNRKVSGFCWKHGRFRPRFIGPAHSLPETFEMISNENAVSIVPAFAQTHEITGIRMRPVADEDVTLKLYVVWQRGKAGKALQALVTALIECAKG